MTAIYIILSILAFLLLILLLPLHLKVSFNSDLLVKVRYIFISLKIYPRKEKPVKEEKTTEKEIIKGKKSKKELSLVEQMLREEGVAAVMEYFSQMVRLTGTAFRKVMAAITVDSFQMDITVASEDAATTALDYGRACAVIYPAEGVVESVVHVRHRSIAIIPDFSGNKGKIQGDIRLHVIPIQILWIAIQFFLGYIGNTMGKKSKGHAE